MTLIQASNLFRIYVNPGTEDDGYVEPEWRIDENPILWLGGAGDWSYVGQKGTESPMVYAYRLGREWVEHQRQLLEQR